MSRPEPLATHQLPYRLVLGKAGNCRHVDVKIIELAAARRRIGADMPRLGGEQRVQRIDPDHRRGATSRGTSEHREIGEITDPPIPLAAQAVKLTAQPPAARARPEPGGKVAAIRCDDQIGTGVDALSLDLEAVIPERQTARQDYCEPLQTRAGIHGHLTRALVAICEMAAPENSAAA